MSFYFKLTNSIFKPAVIRDNFLLENKFQFSIDFNEELNLLPNEINNLLDQDNADSSGSDHDYELNQSGSDDEDEDVDEDEADEDQLREIFEEFNPETPEGNPSQRYDLLDLNFMRPDFCLQAEMWTFIPNLFLEKLINWSTKNPLVKKTTRRHLTSKPCYQKLQNEL